MKTSVVCKNCKFFDKDEKICDRLFYFDEKYGASTMYVEADDFCIWGEENGEND